VLNSFFHVFQPAMPEPVKEVPKAPLPEEHKVLQDIFNNLVHNCQARANNAVSTSFLA
jgi:hypothetical protein